MAATEPIRDKKQVKELAGYWLRRGRFRNYALIVRVKNIYEKTLDIDMVSKGKLSL